MTALEHLTVAERDGAAVLTLDRPEKLDSLKHARELLYSGKVVDAETAERFGMVNRTVHHDDLLDDVMAEVAQIRKAPRPVVTLAKHMRNGVQDQQGLRPAVKNSEFVGALAHLTEGGKRFHEIVESEGAERGLRVDVRGGRVTGAPTLTRTGAVGSERHGTRH
jgi:enoyl-CoA hydratase/carnithine racemase